MARIQGIDLPKNKRGVIGLTYIYGVGSSIAKSILKEANISEDTKVQDWTDDEWRLHLQDSARDHRLQERRGRASTFPVQVARQYDDGELRIVLAD